MKFILDLTDDEIELLLLRLNEPDNGCIGWISDETQLLITKIEQAMKNSSNLTEFQKSVMTIIADNLDVSPEKLTKVFKDL